MSAPTYDLYGLRIRSEIPLRAPLSSSDACDVDVAWGSGRAYSDGTRMGEIVAAFYLNSELGFTHTLNATGYTLQFDSVGEFHIDRQLASVQCHLNSGKNPEYASLLLAGNVMASLLMLSGEAVLHASAVAVAGRAIAFVGHSGMGKSTLAALCCAAGAQLVTDDLLRLAIDQDGVRCFGGSPEVRLRPGVACLIEQLPEADPWRTADDRQTIRLQCPPNASPPLAAIVLPRLDRCASVVEISRLSSSKAMYSLSAHPRVVGWRSRQVIVRQFELMAALVKEVAVYEALIPWGPPFPPNLASQLMGCATSVLDGSVLRS